MIIGKIIIALFSLFVSNSLLAQNAPALDKVTLQLKWKHQFQFAGYYAAIAQGYYREAGLEVVLQEAKPGKDPVEAVLKGEAEFGVGTSELMLLRAKGVEVVVLAAIFQHSPLVLLARRSAEVNDLHDLANQPVMIEPQSAEIFAYFEAEGVDPKKLKIQHHTLSVEDIISGKVAAMTGYSTDEPFQLQAAGFEVLTFTPRAGGIDFYGDNLFTTASQLQRHPQRVKAFREASLRGWEYALQNPQEIIDLIIKEHGNRKTREHLLFEASKTAQLMHPELIEVGYMNLGRWQHIANTYRSFNMVPKDFSLDGFIYDPNPKPNLAWIYWLLGGATIITIAAVGWLLPLMRLNRQLRHEIAERQKVEEDLVRAKEAAEEADRAKGRYLAFMAHEVRTPLGGIMGLTQLIGSESLSPEQKKHLQLVENSGRNLMKLISNTLDFSKLETDRLELEIEPVDLHQLVGEICELFSASARLKNLALRYELDSAIPGKVKTDPYRLRQVLTNLISNALKFTQQGSVVVVVESHSVIASSRKRSLHFHVRDTGEGISPEQIARLFKPYSQASAAVARLHGGTGLGLSIAQRLARLLGGDIRVESTPGKGSTFTVEIVVEDVA